MQEELVPSLVRDLRLPHASQPKIQNRKQKQYCNKSNKDFKNHPSILKKKKTLLKKKRSFSGKESACKAGDMGSLSGLGSSSGEGKGNPVQDSLLENPMDRGA